jgi:hypothetical protein
LARRGGSPYSAVCDRPAGLQAPPLRASLRLVADATGLPFGPSLVARVPARRWGGRLALPVKAARNLRLLARPAPRRPARRGADHSARGHRGRAVSFIPATARAKRGKIKLRLTVVLHLDRPPDPVWVLAGGEMALVCRYQRCAGAQSSRSATFAHLLAGHARGRCPLPGFWPLGARRRCNPSAWLLMLGRCHPSPG